jgi:hypothetical protein
MDYNSIAALVVIMCAVFVGGGVAVWAALRDRKKPDA